MVLNKEQWLIVFIALTSVTILWVLLGGKKADKKAMAFSDPTNNSLSKGRFPEREKWEQGKKSLGNPFQVKTLLEKLKDPYVLRGEVVLRFSSEEAYQQFLDHLGNLHLIDAEDSLRAVRVRYAQLSDLLEVIKVGGEAAPNYFVEAPLPPQEGEYDLSGVQPFEREALRWLGVEGEHFHWGKGVKVAVLDSGVAAHSVFGEGQVLSVDFFKGEEPIPFHGHGTAVASLIAGNHPSLLGVAPSAQIMSFRVTDEKGRGDTFTLAKAIVKAVDGGADVINMSVGSYGDSSLVQEAVSYALAQGVALVAAVGNEASGRLAYPAAYEGVIAVGGVDAHGEHLPFSNRGEAVNLVAPGFGVYAAWPGDQVVSFSGTSASAPFVSGAIAAILSENTQLSPHQATQRLLEQSNEAGEPGQDRFYGSGILNMRRAMHVGASGIYDVGVASHFLVEKAQGDYAEVLITIENRGTEILRNIKLHVETPTNDPRWIIPLLKPGKVWTQSVSIPLSHLRLKESVSIESQVSLTGSREDQYPQDNALQTRFAYPVKKGERN